jgi:hypothetical protein
MSSVFNFKPSPLSLAMKANAVTLFMLMAHAVEARVVTGADEYVRPGPAPDRFELLAGSGLTVEGTATRDIRAESATLVVTPGSSTQDIIANNSRIRIEGSDVTARSSANAALRVTGSDVFISNSTITHESGTGLTAGRNLGATNGSSVTVVDSTITGTNRGASASAYSVLDLTGSLIQATNDDGIGVSLLSGQAFAYDSRIIGGANGVQMGLDGSSGVIDSVLVLDGSSVEGKNGAAILAGAGTNADIQVRNGSTLTGGNGNLLEVTGNSTANMNVDRSFLVGDVVVEDGSTAKVQLNNGSWLTGQLKNVAELSVNDASNWMLVGDSNVEALKMGGGAVHFGAEDQFFQLDVKSLEGNGTFVMHTDFSTHQTDFLNVEGRAEGNHSLLLAATGSELPAVRRSRSCTPKAVTRASPWSATPWTSAPTPTACRRTAPTGCSTRPVAVPAPAPTRYWRCSTVRRPCCTASRPSCVPAWVNCASVMARTMACGCAATATNMRWRPTKTAVVTSKPRKASPSVPMHHCPAVMVSGWPVSWRATAPRT